MTASMTTAFEAERPWSKPFISWFHSLQEAIFPPTRSSGLLAVNREISMIADSMWANLFAESVSVSRPFWTIRTCWTSDWIGLPFWVQHVTRKARNLIRRRQNGLLPLRMPQSTTNSDSRLSWREAKWDTWKVQICWTDSWSITSSKQLSRETIWWEKLFLCRPFCHLPVQLWCSDLKWRILLKILIQTGGKRWFLSMWTTIIGFSPWLHEANSQMVQTLRSLFTTLWKPIWIRPPWAGSTMWDSSSWECRAFRLMQLVPGIWLTLRQTVTAVACESASSLRESVNN